MHRFQYRHQRPLTVYVVECTGGCEVQYLNGTVAHNQVTDVPFNLFESEIMEYISSM